MKSKPITQKAKSSPFKINEALIRGAAEASKKFTDIGEAFTSGLDNGGGKPATLKRSAGSAGSTSVETVSIPKKSHEEAYATRPPEFKDYSFEDYVKAMKKDSLYGTSGGEKQIITTTPGTYIEQDQTLYTKDKSDVLTAPQQRGVNRGLKIGVRTAGQFAAQNQRLQNKIKDLEDRGKKDTPKYARLKAKQEALSGEDGVIEAQKGFANTQREMAKQGKTFGRRDVSYGDDRAMTLSEFSTNEQIAMAEKNFAEELKRRERAAKQSNGNQSAAEQLSKKLNEFKSEDFTITTPSTEEIKRKAVESIRGVGRMSAKAPFKMGGFGSKTYKK